MAASPDSSVEREARSWTRTFASFKNRNYRLFWFGQLLSVTGTWMQRIAQAWLVLDITGSSFSVGLVTALQSLPLTFFALFGGVLADRFPKRRVLVITQAIMAVQALTLGMLIWTDTVQIWHIYLLAVALGLATSFDNPTRHAFVSEMVGKDNLANAVALNSSLFNSARIIGPAIGGAMIAAFDISVPFFVNTVSFLAVITGLLMMRTEELHNVPTPVRGPILPRLREGIGYAVRTPELALVLIVLGFIGTFGYNFNVLMPLIARYVVETGPLGFGVLMTALGAGSLVAALTMAYRNSPSERLLFLASGAFSVLLGLLAFSTWLPVTLAILLALGFVSISFTATANSRMQLLAPGELRGRVMSFYIFLNAGMTPIGALLIGTLSERFSVQFAVGTMAMLCGVGVLIGRIYLARHPHQQPAVARASVNESAPSD